MGIRIKLHICKSSWETPNQKAELQPDQGTMNILHFVSQNPHRCLLIKPPPQISSTRYSVRSLCNMLSILRRQSKESLICHTANGLAS
jgi:hypothetical protein